MPPKKKEPTPLTPLQGLALVADTGLNQEQYEGLIAIPFLNPLFPTYKRIQQLSTKCGPNWKTTYHYNEDVAEINIQALMEHTACRLLMHLDKDVNTLSEQERKKLELKCKWGCDGSQQSAYEGAQLNIIQSSLMPLELVCTLNNKIIWKNEKMWSTRYCRPIRIIFDKLTSDIFHEENNYIKSAISTLKPSKIAVSNKTFTVQHTMMHTEIDGKVCNADTHSNCTQKCYICHLTAKDFNNLSMVRKVTKPPPEMLDFGLSIAHIRKRLFESLLHLSYKLPLKKWEVHADEPIVKQTTMEIQDKFSEQMDLIVDKPKSLYGTYNNGWASRKFFQNPTKTAEITGINVDLIERLKTIVEVISCNYKIDINKFAAYAQKTAELYVELYSWCPMTLTMHNILMHGSNVIKHGIIAIGQTSRAIEKVQNKNVSKFTESLDVEFSKSDCNKEILNDLLIRSDPLITGMSSSLQRKKPLHLLLKETRDMLLLAESDMMRDTDDSEEEVEDSELSSDEN